MGGFRYENQRLMRVWFPKETDHAAWMLMNCVGRFWLLATGWQREFKLLYTDPVTFKTKLLIIDLAHPRLKLALEGDGEQYHRDVVHEQDRDAILKSRGWGVKHYRFPKLKNEPRKVRREVRSWFYKALLVGIKRK